MVLQLQRNHTHVFFRLLMSTCTPVCPLVVKLLGPPTRGACVCETLGMKGCLLAFKNAGVTLQLIARAAIVVDIWKGRFSDVPAFS